MNEKHTSAADKMITVNDCTIYYDDFGEGETPVIFIHGFPFDKTSWQPQMEFLKQTHRVIAYDIRGFGKSNSPGEKTSIHLFADDLIAFMDALAIKKAVVCGLSMGGYILMNAVNRYPEKFEAIVLCDTQCIADSAENKEKRYETITSIKKNGLYDFTKAFVEKAVCQETYNNQKDLVEQIEVIILKTAPNSITSGLKALAERKETCSGLKEIRIPTLIICGKEDELTPVAQSESLHRQIKNSEVVIIYKAGHLSNLEQPEIFNAQLEDFLEKEIQKKTQ